MGTASSQPRFGQDETLVGRIRALGIAKITSGALATTVVLTVVQVLTGNIMDWVVSGLIIGVVWAQGKLSR